jgi:membrane protein
MAAEGGKVGAGSAPALGAAIAAALTLYGILALRRERRPETEAGPGTGAARPGQIPRRGWRQILTRVWRRIGEDNISILAAGVAFYALLSIFPAFSAVVSLYGLIADPSQVQQQVAAMQGVLPAEATALLSEQLNALVQEPRSKHGVSLVVSVSLALWSARAGTGALMTALNVTYGEKERRNVISINIQAFALTAALVLFGIVSLFAVAIVPALIAFLPLPDTWKNAISYVRWPIIAALVIVALAVVYRYAPSRATPRWQWVSWGAVAATALWLAGSALFSLYVAKFGSYDKTYGALGAVVILLLWFYLTAYIILVGAVINAEMEHQTARDTTTGREKPLGARRARMADTVAARP